jgi:hypothetical protein
MVTISLGNGKRKFKSIQAAADALDIPYMTLYMRLRHNWKPCTAAKRKVRVYRKKG